MITAPVQCDVDGIPKGSHYGRVHPVHRIFADAQMNREFAATPVSIHRLAFPWPSFSSKSLKFAIFDPRDLVRVAVLGRPCFLKIVP